MRKNREQLLMLVGIVADAPWTVSGYGRIRARLKDGQTYCPLCLLAKELGDLFHGFTVPGLSAFLGFSGRLQDDFILVADRRVEDLKTEADKEFRRALLEVLGLPPESGGRC